MQTLDSIAPLQRECRQRHIPIKLLSRKMQLGDNKLTLLKRAQPHPIVPTP